MRLWTLLLLAVSAGASSCGGSQPAPTTSRAASQQAEASQSDHSDKQDGPAEPIVVAEVGGLPPEGVARTFRKAQPKIFDCFKAGVQRVPFMAGAVRFWVKVDLQGKFMHAHLERSDLGDRATEQCLLDVLMGYRWPTPVGGKVGVATFEMSFEHAPDIQPPAQWPADKVAAVVESIRAQVEECRFGVPGEFTATVYVKRELLEPTDGNHEGEVDAEREREVGRALAASATPPDEAGEMAVDCIVGVLQEARYPSPGEAPAKVTFKL
jgi:hypothetical protein